MTFEIRSDDVDVEAIMASIRKRIEEKRKGLYTDEEIREIAEHRLDAVLDGHEFNSDLIRDFRAEPGRWNFLFGAETVYESSRGAVGQLLYVLRRALRPIQKLFWNPNPMISALSRQSDLNAYYVHLLHNLAVEITKLNLEAQDLRNRVLQLQGRLEFQARREKTLEDMVVYRDDAGPRPDKDGSGTPGPGASSA
jgi:hypothetical protein